MANFENHFGPLRQMLHAQYVLCPYTVPVMVTGHLNAEKLLSMKRRASISSYLIVAISKTMKDHPHLNASFIKAHRRFGRGPRSKIVQFKEVAASVSIDRTFGGERYPFTYVFRNADKLSVKEVHEKLQYLTTANVQDVPEWKGYLKFVKMPGVVRKIFLKKMIHDEELLLSKIGSFNFTNVGKWKGLEYAYAASPRLVIATGSAENNKIPVSYSFNHVICDGAQVGEFHQDLNERLGKMKF